MSETNPLDVDNRITDQYRSADIYHLTRCDLLAVWKGITTKFVGNNAQTRSEIHNYTNTTESFEWIYLFM